MKDNDTHILEELYDQKNIFDWLNFYGESYNDVMWSFKGGYADGIIATFNPKEKTISLSYSSEYSDDEDNIEIPYTEYDNIVNWIKSRLGI